MLQLLNIVNLRLDAAGIQAAEWRVIAIRAADVADCSRLIASTARSWAPQPVLCPAQALKIGKADALCANVLRRAIRKWIGGEQS